MNNLMDKIDAYLDGTLSAEDKTAFENQMSGDESLRNAVEVQKNLRAGIDRLGMKAATSATFKKMTLKNKIYKWGVATVAITAIAGATYFGMNSLSHSDNDSNITYDLPSTNETGGTDWADADRNLPTQLFDIDPSKDTVIETSGGIVFAIPAGAFLNATDPVTLEIREALTPMDIMKGGLSTTSNGQPLETGGMFYLNARNGETSLKINPDKPVYANVPTNEIDPNMQLFDGERKSDGSINWVNPKPVEKQLIPVNIFSLNFYPDGFKEKVAELGFNANDTAVTDSIYYSYSGRSNVDSTKSFGDEAQWQGSVDSARVRHILVAYKGAANAGPEITRTPSEALERAGEIYDEINSGKSRMIDVVEKYTDDPGSKGGNKGDYGWITPQSGFVDDFKFVGFYRKIGEVVMVQTPFGYHIVQVLDQRRHNYADTGKLEIDPARIAAIRTAQFQNTLIATHEFEERLQVIFKLGFANILDLYVNNLDKKMYEIDSMAMGMTEGDEFHQFYLRHDGGVAISQSHMKELQEYYQKKQEAVRMASEKTYNSRTAEERKQDSIYYSDETNREFTKIDQYGENLKKEYAINLKEAYAQLGLSPKIPVQTTDNNQSYGVTITTAGWKNVDAYVLEATRSRTTLDYTDHVTGKKAVIKYEPLKINIADQSKYTQLMVYLVSDSLPCFMRVNDSAGVYSERLNELMEYSLVVMGEKDGTWFYGTTPKVTPGSVNVTLKGTDEATLRTVLNTTFAGKVGNDFGAEISYMKETHQFNVRREKEKQQHEIDKQIMTIIFPFYHDVPVPDWRPPMPK